MAKALIICYSRTGTSMTVANKLCTLLDAEVDSLQYAGKATVSFVGATAEALGKKVKSFTGDAHDPAKYERIVLIMPVWAGVSATPIRSYAIKHLSALQGREYCVVATSGGSSAEGVAKELTALLGKAPAITSILHTKDIRNGEIDLSAFQG